MSRRLYFSLGAFLFLALACQLTAPAQPPAPVELPTAAPARTISPTSAAVSAATPNLEGAAADRRARLAGVSHWFYGLSFDLDPAAVDQLAASTYDMLVIEPIFTERENEDYPIAATVARLHQAPQPRLVIAYIDIGQAEEWRTYWQEGWEIGDPDWIVALDPDGWQGNYPVAYWRQEWQDIWLGPSGYLAQILAAGFDGVYLDWIEAYSDENVLAAAQRDGVNAEDEMVAWVSKLAAAGRARQPDFVLIAQNAAGLAHRDDYRAVIDAIAQEQTWFDGGAENHPPGDCPLPRLAAEIDTPAYVNRLSPACRVAWLADPDSTLHTSSEEYLRELQAAQGQGVPIFTVDYALQPENVAWVYQTARSLGFIPFVSQRNLDVYLDPVP
jgi:cysteinyl-tRNA synthetase